ncbi:MAG: OmpA family protein [Maribacter sp.]|nr:OmpA family protein [Maribacter sp.]
MKTGIYFLTMVLFLCAPVNSSAQLLKKLKDKAEKKIENKIDGVNETPAEDQQAEGEETATDQIENKGSAEDKNKKEGTTYKSKFDFVPGEKLIVWEDFGVDAVGDFPAKWFTNVSGEVVTLEGHEGKWLMMKGSSQYFIDELLQLPDNFTIQFDLMCSIPYDWGSGIINLEIKELNDLDLYRKGGDMYASERKYSFRMAMHPGLPAPKNSYGTNGRGSYEMLNQRANIDLKEIWLPIAEKNLLHVSIWRQKERLRVYLNENKVLDIPKILPADMKPNIFIWRTEGFEEEDHYFASNLRIAVGNPDTRNKLLTEGKLVTNGILFAVNSDKIKPESYGILKEIAGILKENNDVKVLIVGHTDSDGDEASNLELSKKRAASVKNALSSDFGIDAGRMEIDGKGESQPEGPNNDAISKAKNRRVEFIKTN